MPRKSTRAEATIRVESVFASGFILASVVFAIVDVLAAVLACVSWLTFASVVDVQVHTLCSIDTWIVLQTKLNLFVTVFAGISGLAQTGVSLHEVLAGGVVEAFVVMAIINVGFTAVSFKTSRTLAAEAPKLVIDLTGATILAWTSEASVDLLLAILSMKSGRTDALEFLEPSQFTRPSILARICVANVALGQDCWVCVIKTLELG